MIPVTFPSVFDTDGQQLAVVYFLTDTTGKTKWVDYIPVAFKGNAGAFRKNSHHNDGGQGLSVLTDITGKKAWIDYIPVAHDAEATGNNYISVDPTKIPAAVQALLSKLTTTTANATVAAYSPARKLKADYAGNAMRVRRSSDNTLTDIGFKADGTLDESALTTFVGAGSGFVEILYDQSGNGRNLVQATATYQPTIVSSGTIQRLNTKPAIYFERPRGTILMTSVDVIRAQPVTEAWTAQIQSLDAGQYTVATGAYVDYFPVAGVLALHAGARADIKSITAGNQMTLINTLNSGSSALEYNGLAVAGNPGTTGMSGALRIGGWGPSNSNTTMYFGELLIFGVAMTSSDADRVALRDDLKAHWATF